MTCKLRRYERTDPNGIKVNVFTCDEVKKLHNEWKKKFREENRSDHVINSRGTDQYYENYCAEIDNFLRNCKCTPIIVEQYKYGDDGILCDESAMIQLAKKRREKEPGIHWKDRKPFTKDEVERIEKL